MNYRETLDWMFAQLPMYQRQGRSAYKVNLDNTHKLINYLDHPELKFKSIHVAGTNGKGSTSHMLASVLQEAGYNVGLYTSPHLKDFRERIRVNGEMLSEQFVTDFIANHKSFLESNELSFFEMTVGMAFQYFADSKVDIAIIEVGLGGRLDSTNIILPELSIITNIGLDHTQFLGTTLPEIAAEKGGIIKPEIPVVIGRKQFETTAVFEELATKNKSKLLFAEEYKDEIYASDLKGSYQKENIKTVLQSISQLQKDGWKINQEAIKDGLNCVVKNTSLLGRWQVLQNKPKVICDTAHNKDGLKQVLHQLSNEQYDNLHIVLGVVDDKDLESILPLFPIKARYYFSKPSIARGLNENILAKEAHKFNLEGDVYSSILLAYDAALQSATDADVIYVGGSTFVVAEII